MSFRARADGGAAVESGAGGGEAESPREAATEREGAMPGGGPATPQAAGAQGGRGEMVCGMRGRMGRMDP